jgi:hypothetical protein
MKTAIYCITALLLCSGFLYADGLDDTAVKRVTVRSEAERGFSGAHIVPSHSVMERISEGDSILEQNIQARSDTDAFRMGLNVGLYLGLKFVKSYNDDEASFQQSALALYTREVFRLQSLLKLTDAQMDEIFSDRVMALLRSAKDTK